MMANHTISDLNIFKENQVRNQVTKMNEMLEKAKSNPDEFKKLIQFLRDCFKKNPDDNLVQRCVMKIRQISWPEKAYAENLSYAREIQPGCFDDLEGNVGRFIENCAKRAESFLPPSKL